MTNKVKVVLPAYNEELAIGRVLQAVQEAMEEAALHYSVIVVDDGSTDSTSEVVKAFSQTISLQLVNHQVNRGLAEAVKTGLFKALEDSVDNDIIVTMDSDDSHIPGLILSMVRMIREGNDVVIASRFTKNSHIRGVPFLRQVMSWGVSVLFRLILPIRGVKDFSCGYRAYRAGILKKAVEEYGGTFLNQPGFSCMVDILVKLRRLDPIITEVPLILRYDRKPGASKMNVSKTVRETLLLLFKRRLGIDD